MIRRLLALGNDKAIWLVHDFHNNNFFSCSYSWFLSLQKEKMICRGLSKLNLDRRGGPGYISMSGKLSFLSSVGRIGILKNPTLGLFLFTFYLFIFHPFSCVIYWLLLIIIW